MLGNIYNILLMVLQPNIKKHRPRLKPKFPNFSCGPTKKPPGWSLEKLKTHYFSRYHRSKTIKNYIGIIIEKIRFSLKIPKEYKILITPGSCTGAMEAVIWSLLSNKKKITNLIYDCWGDQWRDEINKLGLKQNILRCLNGKMPNYNEINIDDDIIFVWTGTSTGMSIGNCEWIQKNDKRITICDATSAAFIYKLEWEKLDVTVFSWQKALGSESQHGIVVLSPNAQERLEILKKKNIPKTLDLNSKDFPINTPSLLCLSDFDFSLDWFINAGGLEWSINHCKKNKEVLDKWISNKKYLSYFCKNYEFQSITPCFFKLNNKKNKIGLKKVINFLEKENVAFDIESYRKVDLGIRIWNGPTILKKDLIILTNWLDWTFENII